MVHVYAAIIGSTVPLRHHEASLTPPTVRDPGAVRQMFDHHRGPAGLQTHLTLGEGRVDLGQVTSLSQGTYRETDII